MSLSSAKAKLDAQGGDPATGYISKQDHKDSYDQLVADTALTGATTAEAVAVSGTTDASSATTGTLKTAGGLGVAKKAYVGTDLAVGGALTVGTTVNGRDPDDLAKGPASSTDNALVRFDGTDGKTVQNSGITVDDSNNVTSNLTLSKSAAVLRVASTSGNGSLYFDAPASSSANIFLRSGTVTRWVINKSNTAEAGSNAGSNFVLDRYDDAGNWLGESFSVTRATGKTTLGSVGATAGLELGASGPRVMSGTGSPESAVTAPVGSTWTDTAATTGAIQWIKASGTGNTGWVVEYGDTGWRNVSASLDATFLTANPNATLYVRRTGDTVQMAYKAGTSATFTTNYSTIYTVPSGFRIGTVGNTGVVTLMDAAGPGVPVKGAYFNGNNLASGNGWVAGVQYWGTAVYTTTDAWPSSLPGSAA